MSFTESLKRGFNLSADSIGGGFEFAKVNWPAVYKYLLVSMIVIFGLAAVGGLGLFAAATMLSGIDPMITMGAGGIFLVALLVLGMVYGFAASFGCMEFSLSGKRVGYFERENVSVAWKWALFILVIIAIVILFFIGLFYGVSAIGMPVGILLIFLLELIFIVVALIAAFLAFYAVYEVALRKKGPIEAVFSSYRMVKANFWETLIFMILTGVISTVLGFGAQIAYYILYFLGMLLALANPAIMLVMIVVAFTVMILLSVLIQAIMLPMQVRFYDCIVKGKGWAKAEAVEAKEEKAAKPAPVPRKPFKTKKAA